MPACRAMAEATHKGVLCQRLDDLRAGSRGPDYFSGWPSHPRSKHAAMLVTSDLANFWREHYPLMKSELQRKYPKHEWR